MVGTDKPALGGSPPQCLELLNSEQKLTEIVHLIGPDALPDEQKLVLISSEIIKDGFLQQNSFDEIDMYCVPAKQVRLLELMMEFHEHSLSCLKLGVPLTKIAATGLKAELSRLKSIIKNEDLDEFDAFQAKMRTMLEELERSYKPN